MGPWPLPATPERCSTARRPPPPAPVLRRGPRAGATTSASRPGPPRDATVVVVHGGFWQKGFDRTHAAAQAQAFADDGFSVAVPSSTAGPACPAGAGPARPTTSRPPSPRSAATRPSPTASVLVGHSAGGQLVGWAASQPWAHGLAGVVSLAGCVRPDPHRAASGSATAPPRA